LAEIQHYQAIQLLYLDTPCHFLTSLSPWPVAAAAACSAGGTSRLIAWNAFRESYRMHSVAGACGWCRLYSSCRSHDIMRYVAKSPLCRALDREMYE
jgi:hypothetical protein